ncbi:outer membrane protein assembly factor BamE [Marinicella sp. S1101]|uniref:outer membrane protein assembly factor BamE n=1 Tax=Marinicella marina TaxID=2996016 RepID=UPI002260C0AF|nr:outer membrane protein assembly factor BamE [Marinicella marina]MCX7554652.1 outer membrane protein assembly factor BamE [Marinicella marina]MDJ1140717.1 outer membrane protein assembly factor BamE [Marinicella marina]
MKIVVIAIFALSLSLSGCYKVPVQQGNILKQEDIDEIKPGMTKQQVAIVLGTPTIADPFNQDRWDYINTTKSKGEFKKLKKFSLYFEDNKLVRTEGNYFPDKGDGTTEVE